MTKHYCDKCGRELEKLGGYVEVIARPSKSGFQFVHLLHVVCWSDTLMTFNNGGTSEAAS